MKLMFSGPKKLLVLGIMTLIVTIYSCREKTVSPPDASEITLKYEFASDQYAECVRTYFKHFKSFNFTTMGNLLSDDVMYFSPMGDHENRNVRKGRTIIIPWLTEWSTTSGVDSIQYSNLTIIPLRIKEPFTLYNLEGIVVITFYTGESWYGNRHTKNGYSQLFHFDKDENIDRIYQFNDMHQILEAVSY